MASDSTATASTTEELADSLATLAIRSVSAPATASRNSFDPPALSSESLSTSTSSSASPVQQLGKLPKPFFIGSSGGVEMTNEGFEASASLLHLMASERRHEAVEFLVAHGTEVNVRDALGCTPLHVACSRGHVAIIESLLRAGADIEARGYRGATPLFFCVLHQHLDATMVMLERGASLQALSDDGSSVAMVAAAVGSVAILQQVLEHASDTATVLAQCNARGRTAFLFAAQCGQTAAIDELLRRKAQLCDANLSRSGAVHLACKYHRIEAAQLLLERGCDANARNNRGNTPLRVASGFGCTELVRILVEHYGADVTIRSKGGNTCCHWAGEVRASAIGRASCVNVDG